MFFATFVISTGRCGTQWLAENLEANYGGEVCVRHEPLDNGWCPREMLEAGKPHHLDAAAAAPILTHLDFIEHELESRDYLECGHPCWSSIPYLLERFRGRIRVIHLVRHPASTALSWLTQFAYTQPPLPHLSEKVLLSPFDAGVTMPEYRERWPKLSPYEKCLYWWAEANQFALVQQARLEAPWLRLTYEELFSGDGLENLLAFLHLPANAKILAARARPLDRHRFLTAERPMLAAEMHPRIAAIAAAFGYELDSYAHMDMTRYFNGAAGDPPA